MTSASQAQRPMAVRTPLGPDVLLLVGLTGREAISRPFRFRLDLIAENDIPVPFEEVLGQKVAVELALPGGSRRTIHGICSQVGQGRRGTHFTAYRMRLVPHLWFLTRKAQCRIFQGKTVVEILKEVFQRLRVDFRVGGDYPAYNYCVQYRETDFRFASRLMEEEGLSYYFEHSGGDTLIVTDTHRGQPTLAEPVPFRGRHGAADDEDRIFSWRKTQELRPGKVTLRDHHFQVPASDLEGERTILGAVQAGQERHRTKIGHNEFLEIYDYPGGYAHRFDGIAPDGRDRDFAGVFADRARAATVRMEALAASVLVVRGAGTRRDFAGGARFRLGGHDNADGDYLLTSVRHDARLGHNYRSGLGDERFRYTNTFTCIPTDLPYRPARSTPRPSIHGIQTAVVVGLPGEEIFTDKYGRVKVQFHWDRQGKNDGDSSCWVRVGTPWAGRNWGILHIPRIGQEVVITFEEGDPDRPIIVGSVYNADMMPPYDLPAHQTRSGIKSCSTPDGGRTQANELRFEDATGREQVFLNAERDLDLRVEHDAREFVGQDRHLIVEGDQVERVERDRHEAVGGERREKVGGDLWLQVGGKRSETVGTSSATEAGQEIHLKAGSTIVIEAGTQISLVGPGGFINIGPGGVTIVGTMVDINSGGSPASGSGSSPKSPNDPDVADDGTRTGKLNGR